MWRDIFLNNRDAVLEILQRFSEDLTALQRAIRWGEGDKLQDLFTRTRATRRSCITWEITPRRGVIPSVCLQATSPPFTGRTQSAFNMTKGCWRAAFSLAFFGFRDLPIRPCVWRKAMPRAHEQPGMRFHCAMP